jgi:flavin-dependent dehydrogenase
MGAVPSRRLTSFAWGTPPGIAVGLESGPLAANAITRALASGDFRFTGYRRALRRAVVGRELALDGRLARLLYGSRHWQSWLGLVFFDPRMLALYAARVSGSEILADRKLALVGTLLRHLAFGRGRAQALARATVAMAGTEASSAAPASVDVGRDQRHVG